MTELEYNYIQERFHKKLNSYRSNRKEAYNEGVLACESILTAHFERQLFPRRTPVKITTLDESEYSYLQECFSKKLIRYCTNKEEAYNNGVLACKSILKEIYRRKETRQ